MRFDLDIAVLGGGAAGLMAACAARMAAPGASVAVVERQARTGRKLLATGNGRCNLLHVPVEKQHYHGDVDLLDAVLDRYPPSFFMDLFARLGVEPKTEYGGRVYPASDQASSVLDVLRLSLAEMNVMEECDCGVTALSPVDGGIRFHVGREAYTARRCVACFGGPASPQLGGTDAGLRVLEACGHKTAPLRGSLTSFVCDEADVKPLKGVRYEAALTLMADGKSVAETKEDIIFADYGLSGTAVMNLSRAAGELLAAGRKTAVRVDTLPGKNAEDILKKRRSYFPERPCGEFLTGLVNRKLGQYWLGKMAVPSDMPAGRLTDAQLVRLSRYVSGWEIPVRSLSDLTHAQVTAGGVRMSEVDKETLASKRLKGLYLAGECLDLDGDCGGYNLYWAWASGYLAGFSAAQGMRI